MPPDVGENTTSDSGGDAGNDTEEDSDAVVIVSEDNKLKGKNMKKPKLDSFSIRRKAKARKQKNANVNTTFSAITTSDMEGFETVWTAESVTENDLFPHSSKPFGSHENRSAELDDSENSKSDEGEEVREEYEAPVEAIHVDSIAGRELRINSASSGVSSIHEDSVLQGSYANVMGDIMNAENQLSTDFYDDKNEQSSSPQIKISKGIGMEGDFQPRRWPVHYNAKFALNTEPGSPTVSLTVPADPVTGFSSPVEVYPSNSLGIPIRVGAGRQQLVSDSYSYGPDSLRAGTIMGRAGRPVFQTEVTETEEEKKRRIMKERTAAAASMHVSTASLQETLNESKGAPMSAGHAQEMLDSLEVRSDANESKAKDRLAEIKAQINHRKKFEIDRANLVLKAVNLYINIYSILSLIYFFLILYREKKRST